MINTGLRIWDHISQDRIHREVASLPEERDKLDHGMGVAMKLKIISVLMSVFCDLLLFSGLHSKPNQQA